MSRIAATVLLLTISLASVGASPAIPSAWEHLAIAVTRTDADFSYSKQLVAVLVEARRQQDAEYVLGRFVKGAKLEGLWLPGTKYHKKATELIEQQVLVNQRATTLTGADIQSGFANVWTEQEVAELVAILDSNFGYSLKPYFDGVLAAVLYQDILNARGLRDATLNKARAIFEDAKASSKEQAGAFVDSAKGNSAQYERFMKLTTKDLVLPFRRAFRSWVERVDIALVGEMPRVSRELLGLATEWYENEPRARGAWQPSTRQ